MFMAGTISGHLSWVSVDDINVMSIERQMKIHKKSIRSIGFTPDGEYLITTSKDRSIKIRSTETGKMSSKFKHAHDSPINCLCVVDNCVMATGDDNGCVKLWDYRQKKPLAEFNDCDDYISDLVCANDRRTLLATSGEGTLTCYNVRKKKMQLQSELMDSDLTSIRIFRVSTLIYDGKKVVCGTMDGVLYIFNWKEFGNMSDRCPGHPGAIECIEKINENVICTGCEDGSIRAMHLLPHRFLGTIGRSCPMPINTLSVSYDQTSLIGTSGTNSLQLVDVTSLNNTQMDHGKSDRKKINKKYSSAKSDNFFSDLLLNDNTENHSNLDEVLSDNSSDDEEKTATEEEEHQEHPNKKSQLKSILKKHKSKNKKTK
ncbi:unnamed protein product [Didymodactylos carnosus]|uniref:WD repeat-containing protein 55 n=1 Tax=Didymodactylos carnosus TaxID=1234261 RepID=A0A815I7T5_9BILA|nr:unnamed protein product [Didymodactylos carnosus]CAF4246114.1 unnamed protein product [Didymodactylos carnosus]